MTKSQKANAKCIKNQRTQTHFKGTRSPFDGPHCHAKSTRNQVTRSLLSTTHQPMATPIKQRTDQGTRATDERIFPIASDFCRIPCTKDDPNTPSVVEALKESFGQEMLVLTYFTTLAQTTLSYMMGSSQMSN